MSWIIVNDYILAEDDESLGVRFLENEGEVDTGDDGVASFF